MLFLLLCVLTPKMNSFLQNSFLVLFVIKQLGEEQ